MKYAALFLVAFVLTTLSFTVTHGILSSWCSPTLTLRLDLGVLVGLMVAVIHTTLAWGRDRS